MIGFLVIAQTSTGASRNKIRRYLKYCGYQTTENHNVITIIHYRQVKEKQTALINRVGG
jgi:hypothetical protein